MLSTYPAVVTTIRFDNRYFQSIFSLSEYIVDTYGCWSNVPTDHPQRALVDALVLINSQYHTYVAQSEEVMYWVPTAFSLEEESQAESMAGCK